MHKNSIELSIKVPNQTKYLRLVGKIAEDLAKELDRFSGDKETLAYHMNLVLTEAMTNAIKYGKTDDVSESVNIFITISDKELVIRIYDYGQGFDINKIPAPDFENLEEFGRGIFLIKSLMDSVTYMKHPDGNTLEMIKLLR